MRCSKPYSASGNDCSRSQALSGSPKPKRCSRFQVLANCPHCVRLPSVSSTCVCSHAKAQPWFAKPPCALSSHPLAQPEWLLGSVGIFGQLRSLPNWTCQVCTCAKETMCIETRSADLWASIWAVHRASMARAALLHFLGRRRSLVRDS